MKLKNKPELSEVLKLIKNDTRIVFLCDLKTALGISNTTLYKWYPVESDDYSAIQDALDDNRTHTKQLLRDRFLESKSAAERIALYRLLASPEERKALNQRDEEIVKPDENEKAIVLKIN